MLTKENALYQVKLILGYLPKDEYELISRDTISYIDNNYEYDKSIKIDPNIPLQEQHLMPYAYEILEKVVNDIKNNPKSKGKRKINTTSKPEVNSDYEYIELKNIIETLKLENSKIPKIKQLLEEYKETVKKQANEINELKESNKNLNEYIQKIPKILRKIFVKDVKLLNK